MTQSETPKTPEPAAGNGPDSRPQQDDDSEQRSPDAGQEAARPALIARLRGFLKARNGSSLRDDLTDALSENAFGDEAFSADERAMLKNILRFRELRVEDVMIPRADIEAVELETTLGELLAVFEQSGHSRMPVYGESLDDPRGMVHIRDVVAHITRLARKKPRRNARSAAKASSKKKPEYDLSNVDLSSNINDLNLIRPVLFVPPSMLASDLMARMQAVRIQMALVIDEYGGSDGLVSLEDIVETVVGDIEDEHDDEEAMIVKAGDGAFDVNAKAEIEEVAQMLGQAFRPGEHGEDVDTIGGLIFNALGRVPARGEVVQAVPGFEFRVLEADPRRIKRVRIVQTRLADRRRRIARQNSSMES